MVRKAKLVGLCAAALAAVSLTAPLLRGEVFSVPISDEVIAGDLWVAGMPGSPLAHFEAREGSMVSVRNEDSGTIFGIIPVLDEGGQVTFSAFEINGDDAVEILPGKKKEVVPLGEHLAPVLIEGTPLLVSVRAVERRNFLVKARTNPLKASRPGQLQKLFGASGGGLCSVSCGPIGVAATGVVMDCARCDSGAYSPPSRK
jgi:hypothetical protein